MKKINLTQGKFALVDDEDFEWLNQWKWYYNTGYAVRNTNPKILMHRIIMNTPKDKQVDHINRNRLDNRKENLRNCKEINNHKNVTLYRNNTSGYKGVTWHNQNKKWVVYIQKNKINKFIGLFVDIKKAALAYNKAALKYHGKFASLNII